MVKIFLDTQALLGYLLGNENVVEKVRQYIGKEELCITSLTLFDLSLIVKNEDIVETVSESFSVIEVTTDILMLAKDIYLYVEEVRKPSVKEIITAAACIYHRGFLIPGNKKEYVDIPKLQII